LLLRYWSLCLMVWYGGPAGPAPSSISGRCL
jgi:hypothetical protein